MKRKSVFWFLLLAALCVVPLAAQQSPSLTLTPGSAGVETILTAHGEGFPVGETLDMYITLPDAGDAAPRATLGDVETVPGGEFYVTFPMRATWNDGLPIQDAELQIVTEIVIAGSDASEARATLRYDVPALAELGWQEVYNEQGTSASWLRAIGRRSITMTASPSRRRMRTAAPSP